MKLIRNTLLFVLLLQFLGFLYIKFINKENPKQLNTSKQIIAQKNPLPIPTEYTDYQKIALPLSTEYTDNEKIEKEIKITQKVTPQKPKKIIIVSKRTNKKIKLVKKLPTKKPMPVLKTYQKSQLSAQIEKYARKMLGKKYVWGATGPKCYDCSGFTQRVYRKVAGVKLPRVSYLQAKVGKRISFKKLKQGDMVFFDTEKKRTGRVNHVGIYLGNGNFIHASSGGKRVMITNFRKKRFYKNRFLWGRRVIKEKMRVAINKPIKIKNRKIN